MDLTHTLPDELWSDTFGFLGLQELYVASQVCSYWRSIAFNHPSFWGSVAICSLSADELGWASKRVASGKDRPIHLSVSLPEESTVVETAILPMMTGVLYRACALEVSIPAVYFEQLCTILRRPAPVLERLHLDMSASPDSHIDASLPPDLFCGKTGMIREVHLECVYLPPAPVPAFARAESVILSGADGAWHYLPPNLFSIFPVVSRLSIFGSGLRVPDPISADLHAGFAQLDILDIAYYDSENVKVFQYFPATSSTRHVILSHSDRETIKAAVAHLPEQLMMIFLQSRLSRDEIRIMYCSRDAQRIRTFVELHEYLQPGEFNAANAMLGDAAFVRRIATLRISTSLWHLACPFFPADVNHVEDLIVLVDDDGSHGHARLPTHSFPCPRLKTLIVQAMGAFVHSTAAELVGLSRIVSQARVSLELHCVVLEGDASDLAVHFTSVIRTNEHTQA